MYPVASIDQPGLNKKHHNQKDCPGAKIVSKKKIKKKVKKMNKAEMQIREIGMQSGGVVRKSVCREICKSESYYKKIMQKMKKEGKAKTVFGQGERVLALTTKMRDSEEVRMDTSNRQRLMRQIGISQTTWNAKVAGLDRMSKIDINKNGYVLSKDLKDQQDKGSRAHAVYVKNCEAYVVYNLMKYNIKFTKKIEERNKMRVLTKIRQQKVVYDVSAILYVDNYEMCTRLLENEKEKGPEVNLITPDVSFERACVVLNGEAGMDNIDYVFEKPKEKIKEIMDKYKKVPGMGIGDGVCERGTIYDMTGMELYKLKLLRERLEPKVVVCTKRQSEYLKTIDNGESLFEIVD